MIQKDRGVTTLRVHVRRADSSSEVVNLENITEARVVQGCINRAVHTRKTELMREAATHTYVEGPAQSTPHVATSQPEEGTADIIDQITRLGELHKAGILTQTEFESKKAELLRRL